jgi:hypothetical protein
MENEIYQELKVKKGGSRRNAAKKEIITNVAAFYSSPCPVQMISRGRDLEYPMIMTDLYSLSVSEPVA